MQLRVDFELWFQDILSRGGSEIFEPYSQCPHWVCEYLRYDNTFSERFIHHSTLYFCIRFYRFFRFQSSDCLKQSIEQYRKEAQIVRDNIADIERVIEALKTRCGLAEFGTNPETNILVDFETLKKAA